jgi:hypothetical protein
MASPAGRHELLLIDGALADATGGQTFPNVNPATEEIIGVTADGGEPAGVVGAITPWNFPLQINLAKVAPALAAGNTVVLKPAPDTPWAATMLGRIVAEETDVPAGVFNVVVSSRHEIGRQLAEDPRVDMVSFTGSTATGRNVMRAGAATIKKVFLELGGKSALLALDDADLDTALGKVAFQITTHAGQGCAVLSRLVLPRDRYEEGVEKLVGMLSGWPVGDPTDPGTLTGPLISERQRQRVLGYIAAGRAEGGGIALGPVLVVLAHDGDDDAVAIANDSDYGGGLYYSPDVPFGGYRQSGVGRESGIAGFEEYLEIKAIAEAVLSMVEYDPFDWATAHNPFPVYRELRDEAPVYHNERLGFWALSRYDDVVAGHLNSDDFSSAHGVTIEGAEKDAPFLIVKDPPEHTAHRRIVGRLFTPRRIALMEPFIRRTAADLLDRVRDADRFDVVEDFSFRLPLDVISELIGLPAASIATSTGT